VARRVPLPELKPRLTYLSGAGEALRLAAELGFSVLDISDTQNFMQTHPLLDRISGARGTGLLPSGLRRVEAELMTAHPLGPITEYGLIVVERQAGRDNPQAFEELLTSCLEGGPSSPGIIGLSRVEARPGQMERIDLRLDHPLTTPADLIFTVRTLSGHISFAWCRWYSLSLTIALPDAASHRLAAPAPAFGSPDAVSRSLAASSHD
jgi:hypothetical protein